MLGSMEATMQVALLTSSSAAAWWHVATVVAWVGPSASLCWVVTMLVGAWDIARTILLFLKMFLGVE